MRVRGVRRRLERVVDLDHYAARAEDLKRELVHAKARPAAGRA